jgi:hypothetical protein
MNSFLRVMVMVMGLSLAAGSASGQDRGNNDDPAAPPPLPPPRAKAGDEGAEIPPKVPGEQVEPEVRIHEDEKGNLVEEYRQDGRVYMVKVTPKVGLPNYYSDDDGDGQLEMQESDRAANPVKPVYWKVREWN